MIQIKIDNKTLYVSENKSILSAALDNGIYIPHLCHHPDLPPLGGCGLCVVEIEGQEGVINSCKLKPTDGLNICTKSENLNKIRKMAMELLLACHPEDCSTCPKYGNCEFQTLIQYMGVSGGRFRSRVKGFSLEKENPLYDHDKNRCVLCGRCVRACHDLRQVGVLTYQQKGKETYISTLHNKLMTDEGCRFCGACAQVCPTGAIRDKINYSAIEKKNNLIPCKTACPAHTDIPRYIRLVNQGCYSEAVAVIREKLPLPKILGYICSHVCEANCRRGDINSPVSIRNIKRYAAEHDTKQIWRGIGKQLPDTKKSVCIVGAGPAGITAGYYLRKQGHTVTIKEERQKPGGMMQYGIPSYRLPREIIEEEISYIKESGLNIQTNEKVTSPLDLFKDYDAVVLANGAHKGIVLPIPGHNLPGTITNIDFLRSTNLFPDYKVNDKVMVLGGGNVAFDCARTAKKLGASMVHIACLESKEQMTADDEEIEEALKEGICIHPSSSFTRIEGQDFVTGMVLEEVSSFTFDENKRPIIKLVENSQYTIDVDTVIFAVGQQPDLDESYHLPINGRNYIITNEDGISTEIKGLFACGDVVTGTKSVVEAISNGRSAAAIVDQYLGGDGGLDEVLAPMEDKTPSIGPSPLFSTLKRNQILNECTIDCESHRCLQCDLRFDISSPHIWSDYPAE